MHTWFLTSSNSRLFRKGGGLQLQHLDVSGCKNITDKTLFKLSSSLGKLPVGSGISDIEDSGCDCHTVCSCGQVINITPETAKRGLVYLGLSGCYQVTDAGLRYFKGHYNIHQSIIREKLNKTQHSSHLHTALNPDTDH